MGKRMRWSAARVRWVLLGGVLLLAGVVAGFFGLARYRAREIWQRILARNGVNLRQETNGFTYSQSSKGRTVFTLHASKATPEGKNRWALHDAVLILYGREPGRDDRIYGKEFEYDEGAGTARALGEVHMDLQAPEPGGKAPAQGERRTLSFGPENEAAADPGVIHVRTSGVVYMRKLGLAATGEMTEFRYGGITCTSRGAEFDSGQSVVHLLADVRMSGTVRNTPFTLTATQVVLNRQTNTTDLTAPVLQSKDRIGRAAHAVLHLHKDGLLEAAEAEGTVELRSGTRMVKAPRMTASFGQGNRPEHARLFSGVLFADTDPSRPAQGKAAVLDLSWTAAGFLQQAVAAGGVHLAGSQTAADGATEKRHMAADHVEADFVPGAGTGAATAVRHAELRHVHMTGGAELGSSRQPAGTGQATNTEVHGEELDTTFAPAGKRMMVQELTGAGHTLLEETAPDGARRRSAGDSLSVSFVPASGGSRASQAGSEVASAVQTGHVEVVSWAAATNGQPSKQTTAHGAKATYAGAEKTLTIFGSGAARAAVDQSQGEFAADQIVVHEDSGDAEATGGVIATDFGSGGGPATHVLASRARLLHAAGLSEFDGEAGRPAQMWQGGSQVQAAQITLDQKEHSMAARPAGPGGTVHAVFATAGGRDGSAGKGAAAPVRSVSTPGHRGGGIHGEDVPVAERSAVRVSAARLDYDDVRHEAVFVGGVQFANPMGEVAADRGTAFLRPGSGTVAGAGPGAHKTDAGRAGPDLSGNLERMVMLGDVRLTEPGRTGKGQQLTYTAATDSFALTGAPGKPPRVTGEHGAVVTGATLLFRGGESTIVVAGTEAGTKSPGGTRVHTETDLKQQNP